MLSAVVLTLGVLWAVAQPPQAAAAAMYDQSATLLGSVESQVVHAYMTRTSPSDPRYYANGTWYATDGPPCWYCYDSAAVGAATLASQPGGDGTLKQVAVDTFNTALSQHQLPSGAITDDDGTVDDVSTGFFAVNLGISYLELQSSLDPATRSRWAAAIQRAADFLIQNGDEKWYINGNVNLRQTEVFWLAWTITKQTRFLTAYNYEWQFTLTPPQSRWAGFGLHMTRNGTRSDGADGAAYLAESGGGAPGFDPNYTDAQLDTATDLYVLTRDAKYLRLMNLLFNQLRPRIDANWTLNATGGTRMSFLTPFLNPAVSVLVASGDRPDLAAGLPGQLARVASEYRGAEQFTNPNFYKGFESWLSMPILDNRWSPGSAAINNAGAAPAGNARLSFHARLVRHRRKAATTLRVVVRNVNAGYRLQVALCERLTSTTGVNRSGALRSVTAVVRTVTRDRPKMIVFIPLSRRVMAALRTRRHSFVVRVSESALGVSQTSELPFRAR